MLDDDTEDDLIAQQKAQDGADKATLEAEEAERAKSEQGSDAEAQQEAQEEQGETEGQAEEEAPKGQSVPLAELKRERAARQQAQAERDQQRELYQKLEDRLSHISDALKPTPAQAPNYDEDPAAYLKFQQEQTRTELQNIGKRLEDRDQASQHAQQWDAFQRAVARSEETFKQNQPAYDSALDFLRASRDKEYEAMGVYDPATRQQYIERDAVGIAQQAMQAGKNPAEAVWDLALARGYAAPQQATQQTNTNGAEEKLANVARGQEASRSLSGAGGGNTETPFSLEALASMSDEDFSKIPDSKWREIMGG
jgi:hypothetical protein